MLKKLLIVLLVLIPNSIMITNTYAINPAAINGAKESNMPDINWTWLPWFNNETRSWENASLKWIWNLIWELIKYVSVVAVISVMVSWVMYMVSWGEEEKVKKAKSWIIWSLIWVFISISAWWIINMLNNITIEDSNITSSTNINNKI